MSPSFVFHGIASCVAHLYCMILARQFYSLLIKQEIYFYNLAAITTNMKIFNIFFCFCFIVFAALQYNDPDPYVWIPIYMYTAVLCWLASRNKFYPTAYWIGIIVYAAYATYKVFDQNGLIDWIT